MLENKIADGKFVYSLQRKCIKQIKKFTDKIIHDCTVYN